MFYGLLDLGKSFVGKSDDPDSLRKDEFWAVDNVSFDLKRGETLGIIGTNGSGKSTLLRLISGIYPPDKGEILLRGRVGSLIAIGAGFHPHMSGRENIFLNGTILGMTRGEILANFDSIVSFADIGKFLDAPVSSYSSGMKVRLGFSIAIHIKPEILLVDEVLSVGDFAFQKKSTEKIQELRKNTSTIFVSHSMRQIYRICDRALLIDGGRPVVVDRVEQVVSEYINRNIQDHSQRKDLIIHELIGLIRKVSVTFLNDQKAVADSFYFNSAMKIVLTVISSESFENVHCSISIVSPEGSIITVINSDGENFGIEAGTNNIVCLLDQIRLIPGSYYFKIKMSMKGGGVMLDIDSALIRILESAKANMPMVGFYRESAAWKVSTGN